MARDRTDALDLTFTPDTGIYAAGDVVGGLLVFPVLGRSIGGCLSSVVIVDEDNESADFTLYLFDSMPSDIADQAPFAPTAADMRSLIRTVSIASGSYTTVNSIAYQTVDVADGVLPGVIVYGYLVCTGTPTFAADLTIRLMVKTG